MSSPFPSGPTASTPPVMYHQVLRAPTNGIAVASLVLGIVAIVLGVWMIIPIVGLVFAFMSFVPAVLAVVFGVMGLRRSAQVEVGKGPALAGLVTGGATLAIGVATTLFWVVAIAVHSGSH